MLLAEDIVYFKYIEHIWGTCEGSFKHIGLNQVTYFTDGLFKF